MWTHLVEGERLCLYAPLITYICVLHNTNIRINSNDELKQTCVKYTTITHSIKIA